jgi:predicted lysophospholipase L1 biosynthesis ABC-type transport system permease subunit
VALINDALAQQLPQLPGGDGGALGAQVAVGYMAEAGGWVGQGLEGPPFEVVGVVADVKEYGAVGAARPTVYLSVAQTPDGLMRLPRVLVRAASPAALAPVRERLLTLEPRLRAVEVVSMRDEVAASIAGQRFNAVLMGCFGVMALVLTLVGLYGMLADAVGRRVHEIGIRMALGARPGGVLGLVLRHAMLTVSAGVLVGLAGAFAAGNALRAMTYEIDPTDPRLLAVVTGAFVVVALLACAPPALRATRIDPVEALRRE